PANTFTKFQITVLNYLFKNITMYFYFKYFFLRAHVSKYRICVIL
ncbi:hypothetical protein X975_21177, partial [Stegodyphus mimosarum]